MLMVSLVMGLGKSFSNLKQLESYIQQKINETLQSKHFTETIKNEITTAVSEDIYNSGTPLVYERRAGNEYGGMKNPVGTGSIADPETMDSNLISNGVLEVSPNATRNEEYDWAGRGYDTSKSLAENLIKGYGDAWYSVPRDFLETARESMRVSKSHMNAMRDGLEEIFGKGNVI